MATIGNNEDKEVALIRDSFFSSKGEREFNIKLHFDDQFQNMRKEIDWACNNDPEKYFALASSTISSVELGQVSEENMVGAEALINYCLGKIVDIHPEQTQEITEDAYIPKDDDFCQ